MSTPKDRLFEVYETYRIAKLHRASDWKDAQTLAQAKKIQRNVDALETAFLKAAAAELNANGQAIEDAYQAAREARKTVVKAYEDAKALADRIRAVSDAAKSVASLVKKASAKV
ncbi:MAG: hypothetical protein AAGE86_01335 [Pseudomonadota bacterium]